MNLYQVFSDRVAAQPGHPAVLGPAHDAAVSYQELKWAIDACADRLADAGLGSRASVGLHVSSGLDYIIATYAIWRCGACVVPIPVELAPPEKERICAEIGMDSIVSSRRYAGSLERFQQTRPEEFAPGLFVAPVAEPRKHPPEFARLNSAFLRFTSGTTGDSKGVILSHETIHERIHAANEALRIGPDDRVVWLLSMSYHFAVSIVSYLSFGATIVMCPNHFGETIVETAADRRGTVLYASPVHLELMAGDDSGTELPTLRLPISTTTSLSPEVADAFRARFGLPVVQAYGIIEVGLPCINLDSGERPQSVGRPLPSYELRLDPTTDDGPPYRIMFRGPGMLDAYYEPWRIRDEICTNGWFDTGDLGETDEEGYLFITGRAKDMISVGGMKFFPQEVEDVILSDPRVREVCVFGRADARLGEASVAQVVVEEGGADRDALRTALLDLARNQLASYKIPQDIQFVPSLKRTASGKVIRDERQSTSERS